MKQRRIILLLCWMILSFGIIVYVLLPLTELVFRFRYGLELGEDHYLRMISFGKWDGIVNPPIKYPYFQNSDVFEDTFAFFGGIILGCGFLIKTRISFLLGITGLVFCWFSISIAMYYDDAWSAQLDGQLALTALAAFSGFAAGFAFLNRHANNGRGHHLPVPPSLHR